MLGFLPGGGQLGLQFLMQINLRVFIRMIFIQHAVRLNEHQTLFFTFGLIEEVDDMDDVDGMDKMTMLLLNGAVSVGWGRGPQI